MKPQWTFPPPVTSDPGPLLLVKVPNDFDDWLLRMISSQLHQELSGLDEIISEADTDFHSSGLKTIGLIRVTRLAVVSSDVLLGSIGEINPRRLRRIKGRLARWIEEI